MPTFGSLLELSGTDYDAIYLDKVMVLKVQHLFFILVLYDVFIAEINSIISKNFLKKTNPCLVALFDDASLTLMTRYP